jgi:Na+-translocating ferredoxin:NAD+ oxidoreductase subunit B
MEMTDSVFEQLAEALNRLPNGFPRTVSGVEVRILKKIFPPEQAALACQLTGKFEAVEAIARRAGRPAGEVSRLLFKMARGGMVWLNKVEGKVQFRLAPFVVGVYEAQVELMDHELAHLVEDYFAEGGTQGIMGPQPALQRVVPAMRSLKAEAILPYEDVRAILLSARTFNVIDCICRTQQDKLGSPCKFPMHVCLNFSQNERSPRTGDISQAQALALLEQCEQVGLVHTVSNVMEGVGYVCNCCGCCCGILRGITKFGIEDSVAYAAYYAVIDPQFCANCGNCIERCQVGAISEGEGFSVVDRKRCIGCGLCVSGCPNEVARLERKAEADLVSPPRDYAAWEHARLVNRGLIE